MTLGPSSSAFVSFLSHRWLFNVATSFVNGPLVGAFNQEKALVGAFSVIVQLHLIDLRHYLQQQRLNFGLIIPSVGNCSVSLLLAACGCWGQT